VHRWSRGPRGLLDDPVESGNSLNRIYWSVSRVLRGPGYSRSLLARFSSFILLRVGIERAGRRRAGRVHGFAAHLYTHLPARARARARVIRARFVFA
jgi:hypothetical protein